MYVVIFRATMRQADAEYAQMAEHLRSVAIEQFGCVEFHAVSEGAEEIALSYWKDEACIKAWRMHAEHIVAQRLGRERWYNSYLIQVAQIAREHRFTR
jgi:heme-degrading monooxygenase HmoA